jgi:heat shock protein HslJ
MNYEDRLALVKAYLPDMVASAVRKHHVKSDDRNHFLVCWLQAEANFEIADMYASEFKKRFGEYITHKIENDIRLVAGMTCNFLKAYVDIQEDDLKIGRMYCLVKACVEEQLADFDNWCGETALGMPNDD